MSGSEPQPSEPRLAAGHSRFDLLNAFVRVFLDSNLSVVFILLAAAMGVASLLITPRDPLTNLWVGYTAMLSNRPREAVETYRRFGAPPYQGHALGTDWTNQFCSALHRLGQYDRALGEAHRVLGKKFCLSGGFPNFLLAYGTPDEVRAKCKEIIDIAAKDGGYIMDASAIMQNDARVENVKAMTDFTRGYGVYREPSSSAAAGRTSMFANPTSLRRAMCSPTTPTLQAS